jgi:hypothetical protein
MWNKFVGFVNEGIGAINLIPGVSIGKIPYLAAGGIAYGNTVAMIGEGKYPEAVVPLSTEGISKFARGVGLAGIDTGGDTYQPIFNITSDNPQQVAKEVDRILGLKTKLRRMKV